MCQHGHIGGAGLEPHGEQRQEHQYGPGKRIKEELERGVNPAWPAPHPDDDIHRDQQALEEHVEHEEVGGGEGADHHRFQHQERDHVLAHPDLHRLPARQDADRRQRGGEQDEQHADAVHPHAVADLELGQPLDAFVELESGLRRVKIPPQLEADGEHGQAGPQRGPAGIARHHGLLAADGHQH